MRKRLVMTMEEAKKEHELEAVIYAKITNFEGLQEAVYVEKHVQLEARLESGVKCRVRKTTKDNIDKYEYTVKKKIKHEGVGSNSMEYTALVDKDFYDVFINACDQYFVKTRYIFKPKSVTLALGNKTATLTTLIYEVDVYETENGPCEWCKIDVELNGIFSELEQQGFGRVDGLNLKLKVSNLPLGLENAYLQGQETEEQKAFTEELFNKFRRLRR